MKDKVIIKGLKLKCSLGITEKERAKKQEIIADIEILHDTKKAAYTDDIRYAINYSDAAKLTKALAEKEYKLIETLAEEIANVLLQNFLVMEVKVLIKKPYAIKEADYAAVEIIRKRGNAKNNFPHKK